MPAKRRGHAAASFLARPEVEALLAGPIKALNTRLVLHSPRRRAQPRCGRATARSCGPGRFTAYVAARWVHHGTGGILARHCGLAPAPAAALCVAGSADLSELPLGGPDRLSPDCRPDGLRSTLYSSYSGEHHTITAWENRRTGDGSQRRLLGPRRSAWRGPCGCACRW